MSESLTATTPDPEPVKPPPETPPAPAPEPPTKRRMRGITNSIGVKVFTEDIDAALTRHNGNRRKAAEELHLDKSRVAFAISQKTELREKWSHAPKVPTALTTISRTSTLPVSQNPMPVVKSEAELAAQMQREDQNLRDAFIKLGGTEDEAGLSFSFRSFHGRHIQNTLGLTTTGSAVNYHKMLRVLRKLEARIEAGGFVMNVKGEPTEEAMVMESYRAISEECRKTAELCHKASWMAAKIEALKRSSEKGGMTNSRGKPGFPAKGDTINNIVTDKVIMTT
jgi:hypothetical protein